MHLNPLVSIIIPAYNAEAFIGETIESILAQTYHNIEIIIVDDGSTDRTAEIVQRYDPPIKYYYQKNSGGCSVPRNHGIIQSTGRFVSFIDADDIMLPDRIESQVDFLNHHSEIGLVFCDYRNFFNDEQSPLSHFQTCPRLSSILRNQEEVEIGNARPYLAYENFGIAGSFMLRRELLAYVPGFEPTLKASEDFHFYYRLSRYTKVGIINKVGMLRRLHSSNMSGNKTLMAIQGIRAYGLLRDSEDDPVACDLLNRYIAECWSSLARINANNGKYLTAVRNELNALLIDFNWHQFLKSLKGFARNTAIYLGVHSPNNED